MTLVRALSTPAVYVREGQPLYPVDIEWNVWSRAWDVGDLDQKIIVSAVVTVIIVVGPAHHLDPRGLRLRLPRVPVPARAVRSSSWPR